MPFFGQKQMVQAQKCVPLGDKAYINALEKTRCLSCDEMINA